MLAVKKIATTRTIIQFIVTRPRGAATTQHEPESQEQEFSNVAERCTAQSFPQRLRSFKQYRQFKTIPFTVVQVTAVATL